MGCGDGDGPIEPPPDPPRPATVAVSPDSAGLSALGETVQLQAEVRDQNGQVLADISVAWESDGPAVATVDGAGLVTAAGDGRATITASAGEATGTAKVTVAQSADSVSVAPNEAALAALGDTLRLTAAAFDANGHAIEAAEFSWKSDNDAVATVDGAGLVTAAGDGKATITASAGEATGTAKVTVAQSADSVSVAPNEAALAALGDTLRLTAAAFDANGHAIEAAEFSWKSDNDAVATVDGAGLVTAAGDGRATIIASAGQATGTAEVAVEVVPVPTWIAVAPARATLLMGDTVRLAAEVRDATGATIRDATVAWSSGDESVAPVDRAGLVRAVAAGETVITAKSAELSARARITVVELSDRGALVSLYRSTGGETWLDRTNWLTDAPLGDWYGVTVDSAGRVVRLELDANNLAGPIPPEIAHLTQLRRLTLADNTLDGSIPPEIGRLSLLEFLLLSDNNLSGEIPPEVGQLAAMVTMGMSGNRLNGRIPPEIGRLTRLGWLDLGHNDLTGEIPPVLAIPGLQSLIVAGNLLRGPVPSSFLRSGLQWLEMGMPRHRNLYLCLPGTPAFVAWAARSVDHDPRYCNDSDRAALEALHRATGGAGWQNSRRWLADPAVGEWFGVEADSLGRVVTLDLTNNGLSGELPARLGHLAALTELRIGNNALSGRLPTSLTALSLRELRYSGTGLCAPADASFRAWLSTIAAHVGSGLDCAPTSDRDILETLYRATDGPNWRNRTNWLTGAPLDQWHGVDVDAEGRVTALQLVDNNLNGVIPPELGRLAHLEDLRLFENPLTGPIPPELGNLSRLRRLYLFFTLLRGTIPPELGNLQALEELWLERIPLTGPIPPELGRLSKLRFLAASESNLSGSIPAELGRLSNLEKLYLGGNRLEGSIPRTLGNLSRLNTLNLQGNNLAGSIPAELGGLDRLKYAWLDGNRLTGPVPPELGGLASATILALANNDLSGGLPGTFGRLSRLEFLMMSNNPRMSGVLPRSLAALDALRAFHAGGTGLCAPADPGFQAWLGTVTDRRVSDCPTGERSKAYLTQAAQSLDYPVPLVADEPALLRVFVTAATLTDARIPPVRATFYHGGAEAHVAEIAGGSSPIPTDIEEDRLSKSANARIPAGVIRPGLEMVIEIDPQSTLDPGLGVQRRIPETGRAAVDVVRMPPLRLTWIPMISGDQPDSSIVATARGLTAGSPLFREIRTLLPVGAFELTVHDPVLTSTRDSGDLLRQVEAIRLMEGRGGHYMGTMANPTGSLGVAYLPGRSSVATLGGGVMAHELGHNMRLFHAPCGGGGGLDPFFPSATASIGVWGYDIVADRLIPATHKDLMSYCHPQWISDYSFAKALRYRLFDERSGAAAASSAPSLLLWGGVGADGAPLLEPAFVVDAPAVLPDSGGEHRIIGLATDGSTFFSVDFTMPRVAGDDGRSSFAFTLPVRPEWEADLASITLSGPGGSVTLDADTDLPMTILRNRGNGQVVGMTRGLPPPARAAADAAGSAGGPALDILFSRGIPDARAAPSATPRSPERADAVSRPSILARTGSKSTNQDSSRDLPYLQPRVGRAYHAMPSRRICSRSSGSCIESYRSRSTDCAIGIRSITTERRARSVNVNRSPNNAMSTSEVTVFVPVALDPNSTARSTRSLAARAPMIASRCASLRPSLMAFAWRPGFGRVATVQGGSVP